MYARGSHAFHYAISRLDHPIHVLFAGRTIDEDRFKLSRGKVDALLQHAMEEPAVLLRVAAPGLIVVRDALGIRGEE